MKKNIVILFVVLMLMVGLTSAPRTAFADISVPNEDVEDMVVRGEAAYQSGKPASNFTGHTSGNGGYFAYNYCLNGSTISNLGIRVASPGPFGTGVRELLKMNAGTLFIQCSDYHKGYEAQFQQEYAKNSGNGGLNVVIANENNFNGPQRGDLALMMWTPGHTNKGQVVVMTSKDECVYASDNTVFSNPMFNSNKAWSKAFSDGKQRYFGEGAFAYFRFNPKRSGSCGTNVWYEVDNNTITFSREDPELDAEWSNTCKKAFSSDPMVSIVKINDTIRMKYDGVSYPENFSDCKYVREMYLSKLDVSQKTNFRNMFSGCTSLTKLDISGWNTSNVSYMSSAFLNCFSLKSLDLSGWKTSNSLEMNRMFENCSSLTSLNVKGWDTSNVLYMDAMFKDCSSLTKLDLSNWDNSRVESMNSMFYDCSSLTSLNLTGFKTNSVTLMSGMFANCSSLTSLNLSSFNTANVTTMLNMFTDCTSLTSLNIAKFNTANVTSMSSMFAYCSALPSLNLSSFNTSSVTTMQNMFAGCSSLKSLNVTGFKTNNVTDMTGMFSGCSSLTSLNLTGFNTSKVTSMSIMFQNCSSLTAISFSQTYFKTDNVTSIDYMFAYCSALSRLNLSSFNTAKVTQMDNAFFRCSNLVELTLGKNTLKKNIFPSLPNYKSTWGYISAGSDAGNHLPIGSTKKNGELFESYDYTRMAGTWNADKDRGISSFINRCYDLILGRKADQGGLTFYRDQLKSGKLTGAQMVMNFVNSPEFQGKKYSNEKVVEILYLTMMDRTAEAKGRAYWAGFLNDGMSQKYVVRGFAGSKEFKNICTNYGITAGTLTLTENRDKNPKVTAFVSRNYSIALGRKGDTDGLNYWTGMILTKNLTPQQVADSFVFSKECVNKNLNDTEFVKMLYRLYMGREYDQGGLNFWLQQMNKGMTRQTVAKSFGASNEFKQIVASYGL